MRAFSLFFKGQNQKKPNYPKIPRRILPLANIWLVVWQSAEPAACLGFILAPALSTAFVNLLPNLLLRGRAHHIATVLRRKTILLPL
jgi:hypothetical protein